MNRTYLVEAVLGVTVGLLLTVVLSFLGKRDTSPLRQRRAIVSGLIYAVIVVPLVVRSGMTLVGLALTAALLCLPFAGALLAGRLNLPAPSGWFALLVPLGLAGVVVIASGQTLAVMGLLDPRMVVIAVAALAVLVTVGGGLIGVLKVTSWAVWLMIVPVILAVVLGFAISSPGAAVSATVGVPGPGAGQWLSMAVVLLVLGAVDPILRASLADHPVRALAGLLAVVLLGGGGLLMFYAGSIISPSLQFSTLVANLDIVPGPMLLLLTVFTVLFVGALASVLQSAGEQVDIAKPPLVAVALVVGAVILAMLGAGLEHLAVVAGLLAAGQTGAGVAGAGRVGRSERASWVVLAAAALATVVLAVTSQLAFGWAAVAAVVILAAIGWAAGRVDRREPVPARDAVDAIG